MVLLFAAALFAGSFLLFLVEPMAAKTVLPRLGGAPMVWNTCVVFFQTVLLAGYGFAYLCSSRRKRGFVTAYAMLLAVPLVALPIAVRPGVGPSGSAHPVLAVMALLTTMVGLPFLALAASASLLQRAFAGTIHPAARDPYFLYAASNLGSLVALLLYPILIEPEVTLHQQMLLWSMGYACFAALALACVTLARRRGQLAGLELENSATSEAPGNRSDSASIRPEASSRHAIGWIAWSFIPSSLMLAVTSYLSTDVAAVPLLWIVPLTVYLLTFVLAFSVRRSGLRIMAARRLPLVILPIVALEAMQLEMPNGIAIPFHLLVFAVVALLCHARLADSRPPRTALTAFYFWIALGGLLGGVFSTLVTPLMFTKVSEYPILLVLACLARASGQDWRWSARDLVIPVGVGLTMAAVMAGTRTMGLTGAPLGIGISIPLVAAFSQLRYPVRFAAAVAAILIAGLVVADPYGRVLHAERTFFGVYRVSVDQSGRYRVLFHGTTLHGKEALDPKRAGEPLAYYHRTGPFGQAFTQLTQFSPDDEIAVVGLGVGSLAAYATDRQRWTFFEIDPAVERLARRGDYFTFLQACGARCQVIIGDARLSLEKTSLHAYRLIVLDAFSSDAIPMHLLTREALSLYLSRLEAHGVLAFHVSNRHLALSPVLGRLASAAGLTALRQEQVVIPARQTEGIESSEWLLMARESDDLWPLQEDPRWAAPIVPPSTPLWTDDFSNILSAVHFSFR